MRVAISGYQWLSVAISGYQWLSVAISGQLIKALGRHCNNRKYGDTKLGSAHAKESEI